MGKHKAIFYLFYSCYLYRVNLIKVAYVGDSITYGSGIKNRDSLAYHNNCKIC